jgi:Na+-translocating ferredoxin:NAD+ oxidoreductase subunit G
MSTTKKILQTDAANSNKMLQAMVGLGIICALLIVVIYESTLPRIKRLKAEALEKAVFKVLPGAVSSKAFLLKEDNTFTEVKGDLPEGTLIFAGYDVNKNLVGLAIEASGQGYADIIRILYGYDPEREKVIGFYVLETKETPGLGDKIEKDPKFLANFVELDVSLSPEGIIMNPVVPVKSGSKENLWEVDGITGATISSRAIANIIDKSSREIVPVIFNNVETFKERERSSNGNN